MNQISDSETGKEPMWEKNQRERMEKKKKKRRKETKRKGVI